MAENPQPQNTPLIQNGERRRTYLRLITEIAIAIVGVVALGLLGRPVLGILMPFILAFIMASAPPAADAQAVLLYPRSGLLRAAVRHLPVFRRSARFSGD